MGSCKLAEIMGSLQSTLAAVSQQKNISLTKLAQHSLPSGAGQKNGKAIRKKKTGKVQSVSDVLRIPLQVTVPITTPCSIDYIPPLPPPLISIQDTVFFSQSGSQQPPSSLQSGFPSTSQSPFGISHAGTPINPIATPLTPPTQFMSSSLPPPIFPAPMSEFTLIFLHGNIRVCAGCHQPFPKQGNTFADPPFNIAVRHQEDRKFISPVTSERMTKYGNAYYHVYLNCIHAKWPDFEPLSLVVPNELRQKLLLSHKQLLHQNFAIQL